MMQQFQVKGVEALHGAATALLSMATETNIIALFGSMGSGKTTLITEAGRQLGLKEQVTSPSFSLVNEYTTKQGEPVYHFDFYRIEKIEEVFDIGYEQYFYSPYLCFIEWPEKIMQLLPQKFVKVDIRIGQEQDEREIIISLVHE